MASPESIVSLSEKLNNTLAARHFVESLYLETFSPFVRTVHKLCNLMPEGALPIAIVWTILLYFVPNPDPEQVINAYALGLLTLFAFGIGIYVIRAVHDHTSLDDVVLARIATHDMLAYHPNAVLRRSVARSGKATQGEFRIWAMSQRDILTTKAKDYEAWIETLKKGYEKLPDEHLPEGAKAFLRS
jgi:hypothetical protein